MKILGMNKNRLRTFKWLLTCLLIIAVSLSLIFIPIKKYTYQGFFFDTYVRIKIYERNPIKAKRAIKRLIKEFKRIDKIPVNGIKEGKLDTTTIHIIELSLDISRITNGAFDPTVDPILREWNYFKEPTLPDKKTIDSLLSLVDYSKITLIQNGLSLFPGSTLTLGGSAKGYALNRAKKILKETGISSGLIEAGGDIVLFGRKKNHEDWTIGVRHPRKHNEIIGLCKLSNCFVATSGDYERFFFLDSIRFHHIINPKTGYPAMEIQSVTVIGNNGFIVDALSTALFAMGISRAIEFIEKNNIEAIIVDSSGKIHNFIENFKME